MLKNGKNFDCANGDYKVVYNWLQWSDYFKKMVTTDDLSDYTFGCGIIINTA